MRELSIAELVERAYKQDQTAVAELYERTYKAVYLTIKSVISNEDTVLDLTQDTFVKAFSTLDRLSSPEKFPAWVKVIARNQALDYLRRAKPVLFSEITSQQEDEDFEFTIEDETAASSPEACIDIQETSRLVNEILGTLSDSQRLVVGLYYYEELSVKEISTQTGMSENSVKVHLHNGRKRIEDKVLDLERKGTKLYGFAPIPFLLWLLRGLSESGGTIGSPNVSALRNEIESNTKSAPSTSNNGNGDSWADAGQNVDSSASPSNAANAGKAAPQIVRQIAGASLKTKMIAGAIAAAIGFAVIAGVVAASHSPAGQNNEPYDREEYNSSYEDDEWATDYEEQQGGFEPVDLDMFSSPQMQALLDENGQFWLPSMDMFFQSKCKFTIDEANAIYGQIYSCLSKDDYAGCAKIVDENVAFFNSAPMTEDKLLTFNDSPDAYGGGDEDSRFNSVLVAEVNGRFECIYYSEIDALYEAAEEYGDRFTEKEKAWLQMHYGYNPSDMVKCTDFVVYDPETAGVSYVVDNYMSDGDVFPEESFLGISCGPTVENFCVIEDSVFHTIHLSYSVEKFDERANWEREYSRSMVFSRGVFVGDKQVEGYAEVASQAYQKCNSSGEFLEAYTSWDKLELQDTIPYDLLRSCNYDVFAYSAVSEVSNLDVEDGREAMPILGWTYQDLVENVGNDPDPGWPSAYSGAGYLAFWAGDAKQNFGILEEFIRASYAYGHILMDGEEIG